MNAAENSIGVRELRQNASKYLRRVAAGESFTVTDRGTPVAELVPPQRKKRSRYEEMVASGEITPAKNPGLHNLLADPLPPSTPSDKTASEILQEMREDRF
ncbi:MAG: type II toxin-antitoxin system Phd/YefM family antitoxin [Sciscionella sp.]|nr:type II toxin-antitoxin system Phd/YefM family antitoxin [Sciscionella sp.]